MKRITRSLALLLVAPLVVSFLVRSVLLGKDRALMGSSQLLALVPGVLGQYVRTAFLRCVLDECDPSAVVEFGTILSQTNSRIRRNVYVGPMCHLGSVILEEDVLIGAAVHIPSGPDTHGIADINVPIREQRGTSQTIIIGTGSWIGSGAIVMADVGERTVIAAGAIVTKPIPSLVVAGGIPARVLRTRS